IAAVRRAIEEGDVLVNSKARSSGWRVRAGDRISVALSEHRHRELAAESIALEILYQDQYIIAINKPPMMLSHPSTHERGGTLINALLYYLQKQGEPSPRPALVH